MTNSISEANREVARLSRDLDITNADHIALWIEANTIPDEPMSQCASWLACRIVEAHEAAMSRASQPVDTGVDGKRYVAVGYCGRRMIGWGADCKEARGNPRLWADDDCPDDDALIDRVAALLNGITPPLDSEAVERVGIMAKQKLTAEMDSEDAENADYQGAYEWFVTESRALLSLAKPVGGGNAE